MYTEQRARLARIEAERVALMAKADRATRNDLLQILDRFGRLSHEMSELLAELQGREPPAEDK